MYCLRCFALLVLSVAAAKIHFEEEALIAGMNQSSQANKADRLTSQAGRKGSRASLLCFVLACSA
jgi:hypothetical protein